MPLTDRDYDLLSLYIDDALTPPERRALESRLKSESELRAELDALRQTIALLNAMPEMIAPRDLRLSPHAVADTLAEFKTPRPVKRAPLPFTRVIANIAAAAASLVLVLAGTFSLIQPAMSPVIPRVAMQSSGAVTADSEIAGTPTEKLTTGMIAPVGTPLPEIMLESAGGMGGETTAPESESPDQSGYADTMQMAAPTDSAMFETIIMPTDEPLGESEGDTFFAMPVTPTDEAGLFDSAPAAPVIAGTMATQTDDATGRAMVPPPAATLSAQATATHDETTSRSADAQAPAGNGPDETAVAEIAPPVEDLAADDALNQSVARDDQDTADGTLDAGLDTGLPASSPILGLALIVAGLALGVSTLIARNRR